MRILIVIPAHNEEGSLPSVLHEVREEMSRLPHVIDIVVVDDASTDATRSIAEQAGVAVISLPLNLGIGGAVQTGYRHAKERGYDVAVQIDGDGQHPPGGVGHLIRTLVDDGADIVIGSRFIDSNDYRPSFARRLGITFTRTMLLISTGKRIADTTSGFRAVNRRLIELFADDYPRMFAGVIPLAVICRKNYRYREIGLPFRYRRTGQSYVNWGRGLFYPVRISLALLSVLLRH